MSSIFVLLSVLMAVWGTAFTFGAITQYQKLGLDEKGLLDFLAWMISGMPKDWKLKLNDIDWTDSSGESPQNRKKAANLYIDDIIKNAGFSQAKVEEVEKKIGEEEVEVPYATGVHDIRPLQDLDEIPDLLDDQHAYPEDMFYEMLAKGELYVRKDVEVQGIFSKDFNRVKKQRVITVDCSGSMQNERSFRQRFAFRLAKAFVKDAQHHKAATTLIFFSAYILDKFTAQSSEEYAKLYEAIEQAGQYAGGTNLDLALMGALDCFEEMENYDDAQVIMITDGTEGINSVDTQIRMKKLRVRLHTICVGEFHRQLHRISNEFYLFLDRNLRMR